MERMTAIAIIDLRLYLKKILPKIIKTGGMTSSIWRAATNGANKKMNRKPVKNQKYNKNSRQRFLDGCLPTILNKTDIGSNSFGKLRK